MNTTDKATPRPYVLNIHPPESQYFGDIFSHPNPNDPQQIRTIAVILKHGTPEENAAHGEFILRAINAHDDLLAACEEILAEVYNGHNAETGGTQMVVDAVAKAKGDQS